MEKREKRCSILQPPLLCLLLLGCAAASSSAAPSSPVCGGGAGAAPVLLGEPLRFCGYAGISCCDAAADAALEEELLAMNLSDAATCAAIVKAFLCARCIPSLSPVLNATTAAAKLSLPLLCGASSTPPPSTSRSRPRQPEQEKTTSMCLERISAGSYQTMAAHPDGSPRAFLSSQDGKIWLAEMPRRGGSSGGGDLHLLARPFLDLTDRVLHGGLVGVAFHPDFATNGRFFVSYKYQLVVAEFLAQGGAAGDYDYTKAIRADPTEVRRVFTLGLPRPPMSLYSYQRHGGQILFRPGDSDAYLYLITGHGDHSSSENRRSLLGKIVRLDVGGMPGASQEEEGEQRPVKPEIFSMGPNNPSGCSFDSQSPSYFYCADVDNQKYERVFLVSKGGVISHGGRPVVVNHGRPVDGRMPSIVGGLVYRGSAAPSFNGRYLYMYMSGVWSAGATSSRTGERRHYASARVPYVRCSGGSPVPCRGGTAGISGRVLWMGEDNSRDAFILATSGVYRLVPPGACGVPHPPPPQWAAENGWVVSVLGLALVIALYWVCCSTILGDGRVRICNEWFRQVSCCIFICCGGRANKGEQQN